MPRSCDDFFDSLRRDIAAYYLAEPDNPYRMSGRSKGAERWEETLLHLGEVGANSSAQHVVESFEPTHSESTSLVRARHGSFRLIRSPRRWPMTTEQRVERPQHEAGHLAGGLPLRA